MEVIFALDILAGLVALGFLGLFLLALRRWFIQRAGGTFDCSLRLSREQPGQGWVFGVARYIADRVEWFRVFSYSPRPREVLFRRDLEILGKRMPEPSEEVALLAGTVVLQCSQRGRLIELAMSEDALTGLLSWLEAAPPGQRTNVA